MKCSTRAVAIMIVVLLPGVARGDQGAPDTGLTLAAAMQRADAHAYANRIADGEVRAQAGDGMRVLQGVLPVLRVESGFQRTTDPIGAFGTKLRQRSIVQQDFDPAQLNHPGAISNWTGALVVEQPLINVDAWFARRAATHAIQARQAAASWTAMDTRVDVVRAYYGAVLAVERVATLKAALDASRAHVRQAESMVRQGVVTRSDALLAAVRAGEVETQLLEAEGAAGLAVRQLAALLGAPDETAFQLPQHLPSAEHVAMLDALSAATSSPDPSSLRERSDVRAAEAGLAAARSDARRTRALWLPRLNAGVRYDWHSAERPYAGDGNWSVGVMASWSPFAGASQLGQLRATRAREQVAAAQAEAARAEASLDVARQERAWRVALERMRIAGDAVTQSTEAHRIVARKYEGGLATVVELLGAQAAETESRLRHTHSRHDAIVRAAERLRAHGSDPALLADWAVQS